MLPERFRLGLPNDARAPGLAREHATRTVRNLAPAVVGDVALIVSELVTNAVLHGDGPRWLAVDPDDGCVRIEVADSSPRSTVAEARPLGGMGLRLVDELSDSWGVDYDDDGKVLWSVLDDRPNHLRDRAPRRRR